MEAVEVHVDRRTQGGKGAARKLRRAGMIPAVFYGPKRTTVAIGVQAEEFDEKLKHLEGSHLIRLVDGGGSDGELHDKMVLLREVQRHPVSGKVLHADFYEVDLAEPAGAEVCFSLTVVAPAAGLKLVPSTLTVEPEAPADGVNPAMVGIPATATTKPCTLVAVLPPTVEEAKPAEAAEAVPAEGAPAEGAPVPGTEAGGGGGKKGGGEG